MPKKRFRAEQIVVLLRQIEVLIVITYYLVAREQSLSH